MKICLKILPVVSLVVVSTFSYGEESWDLVAHEDFNNPIDSSNYNWVEDLGGTSALGILTSLITMGKLGIK